MSSKTYFQYQKELNVPVFIAVNLEQFEPTLSDFFGEMKFTKLSDKEVPGVLEAMKKNNKARFLNMGEATPNVARQIHGVMESDHYGVESVIPKIGYQVYRYKDQGLMIYSFGAKVWELGAYSNFAQNKLSARMIINRFLTWALVSQGILGLWGVAVDGGVVLQRPKESKGEVVFIDVVGNKIFTMDGVKKLGPKFKVLRLDPTLRGRNIRMRHEELLSFMSAHTSYLDISGLSVPVRQMIQTLAKMTEGLVHPEESFRPRTDLSL